MEVSPELAPTMEEVVPAEPVQKAEEVTEETPAEAEMLPKSVAPQEMEAVPCRFQSTRTNTNGNINAGAGHVRRCGSEMGKVVRGPPTELKGLECPCTPASLNEV